MAPARPNRAVTSLLLDTPPLLMWPLASGVSLTTLWMGSSKSEPPAWILILLPLAVIAPPGGGASSRAWGRQSFLFHAEEHKLQDAPQAPERTGCAALWGCPSLRPRPDPDSGVFFGGDTIIEKKVHSLWLRLAGVQIPALPAEPQFLHL